LNKKCNAEPPGDIDGHRPGYFLAAKLCNRDELRADDFTIVERQLGQVIEVQLENIDPFLPSFPAAADLVREAKGSLGYNADFLGEFTAGCRFGRLSPTNASSWKIPGPSVRRPEQKQRLPNMDRDQGSFMTAWAQPPPCASQGEGKTKDGLPCHVHNSGEMASWARGRGQDRRIAKVSHRRIPLEATHERYRGEVDIRLRRGSACTRNHPKNGVIGLCSWHPRGASVGEAANPAPRQAVFGNIVPRISSKKLIPMYHRKI
jgi:hypothetical protein